MYKPTPKSLKIAGILVIFELFQNILLAPLTFLSTFISIYLIIFILGVFFVFIASYKIFNLLGFLNYYGSFKKANTIGVVYLVASIVASIAYASVSFSVQTAIRSPLVVLILFLSLATYIVFGFTLLKYKGVLSNLVKPLGVFIGFSGIYSFAAYFIFTSNPFFEYYNPLIAILLLLVAVVGMYIPFILYTVFFFKASKVVQERAK